jgi:hypothetical protein
MQMLPALLNVSPQLAEAVLDLLALVSEMGAFSSSSSEIMMIVMMILVVVSFAGDGFPSRCRTTSL